MALPYIVFIVLGSDFLRDHQIGCAMEKQNHVSISCEAGKVLLVEDDPAHKELLRNIVDGYGYDVLTASDGAEGIAHAISYEPDVILSDVMMPRMDGIMFCKMVKDDASTAHIPVILVTALHDKEHRLKGIEAGANEFLTKPIDPNEVGLRVRNAVYSKKMYENLKNYCKRLKEMEELRDTLVNMLVHDMRTLLMGVTGNVELLQLTSKNNLSKKHEDLLNKIMLSSSSLMEMISTVIDVSRIESNKMPLSIRFVDIRDIINKAVEMIGLARDEDILSLDIPRDPVTVACDPGIIRRVVVNLLSNGIKAARGQRCPKLSVSVAHVGEKVRISVSDNGPGIAPEHQQRIFDKFAQAGLSSEYKRYSSGMGLYFCKLALNAHKSRIQVMDNKNGGSVFYFDLDGVKVNH